MSKENKTSGSVTFILWVLTIAVVALSCWNISLTNANKAIISKNGTIDSLITTEGYSLIQRDDLNYEFNLIHSRIDSLNNVAHLHNAYIMTNLSNFHIIIKHEDIPKYLFKENDRALGVTLRELGVLNY